MQNVLGARQLPIVLVLLGGCYDTSIDPPDAGAGDTDYDSDFDGDTGQCNLVYDTCAGNALTSYVYEEGPSEYMVEAFDSQWNGSSWDSVALIELYGAEPGDVVDLQFQTQYETCDYCVLLFLKCPFEDLNGCDQAFVATSGLLHVIDLNPEQPWGNDLEFAVADAVLKEIEINWNTYESTLLDEGERICVGLWHVETVPELP